MASIIGMVGGAVVNALAFTGSSFFFNNLANAGERSRHNLAMEKLQHDRDKWNQERLKRIDYVNDKLIEQGHAARTFQSVNAAMQEYYALTGENLYMPPMRPEPQLDEDDQANLQTVELVGLGTVMLATGAAVLWL